MHLLICQSGGGRMRKGEGSSANLIQELAMACLNLEASQPEVNIFALHFYSNDTETDMIIPI